MKEDSIRSGNINFMELNREVQPDLRKSVLKRDGYKCKKCGTSDKPLHCHHIYPITQEPLLSADIDCCITLCNICHKNIHSISGCRYNELKMEMCL